MPSVEAVRPTQQAPDDEEEPDEISWNLGFVEEPEKPHLLLRHRFPSKVGGRPAWLDPVRLPTREMLTCRASGRPLDFLLQIYAPVDANPVEGFHRSLFLFVSPEGSRLHEPGAVRLFRCQLPRHNPYYSSEPPGSKDKHPQPLKPSDADASRERDPWRSVDAERPQASYAPSAPSSAAARKRRNGGAAAATAAGELAGTPPSDGAGGSGTASAAAAASAPLPRTGVRGPGGMYPELELVVEPEDEYRDEDEDEDEDGGGEAAVAEEEEKREEMQQASARSGSGEGRGGGGGGGQAAAGAGGGGGGGRGGVEAEVRRALQQYRARVAEEGELDDEELPPDVVEAVEGAAGLEQRCFADFQTRVSCAPEQVIRYCFQDGARPLWPAPHGQPGPGDIPACPCCGSPRKMEFQVLPQLLHYLQLDEEDPASPDWCTMVGYTCAASCSPSAAAAAAEAGGPAPDCAYVEEVVWVQPPAP